MKDESIGLPCDRATVVVGIGDVADVRVEP
jgi:hypothetical protein